MIGMDDGFIYVEIGMQLSNFFTHLLITSYLEIT